MRESWKTTVSILLLKQNSMNIIYVLIPLAIVIVLIAIAIFFWAVKSDQFNDLERQGYSILFDEDVKEKQNKSAPEEPKEKPNDE